jgi:hypothetical protein
MTENTTSMPLPANEVVEMVKPALGPLSAGEREPGRHAARQTSLARGCWRLFQAIRHCPPRWIPRLPVRLLAYLRQWRTFQKLGGIAEFADLAPCLFDLDASTQSGGGQYFYQDVWALRHLAHARPAVHHDVGSRLDGFVAQATAICPVVYYDIRPPCFQLPDFTFVEGSILELPVGSGTLASVSCLHVAEHIGLGRYGDPLDPQGADKSLVELQRVLAPGGMLLFSTPIGRERIEFNAQRIWNPLHIVSYFAELELVDFSAVDDAGEFRAATDPADFLDARYACGLYCFLRPA